MTVIINREEVIARAHQLAKLRVPFVHQGRTLEGIDCIGGLAWILSYLEPLPAYPRDPVNGELELNLQAVFGEPVLSFSRAHPMRSSDIHLLQPCDILSMQYRGPIRHVGIVVPYEADRRHLSLVHTDSDVGHTTECLFDDFWIRRTMRVWRPQVATP